MYDVLIDTFENAIRNCKDKYIVDSVQKSITISNPSSIETISKNSDIICYYDMVTNEGNLIFLVERVPRSEVLFKKRSKLRQVRCGIPSGYYANCNVASDKEYIDYVVLNEMLYTGL